MNLDKALGLMGVSGSGAPPEAAINMGNGSKAAAERAPETKKQKEAREAKEKEEKRKKKIAAAMFKKDEPKKEKKEKKEADPPAGGSTDGAGASGTNDVAAPAEAAAQKPKAAAKKVHGARAPRIISDEERQRAIAAVRQINDEAERAFATAYQCSSAHKAVSAEAIDYHVRTAEELDEARGTREANAAAAAAAAASKQKADAARKAIASPGCQIKFEEWQLLLVAGAA